MRAKSCNMLFRDHKRTKLHAMFLSLVSLWAFHRMKHASDFTTIEIQRLKLVFSTKHHKKYGYGR